MSMAEEIKDLLKRQTTAGTVGNPPLTEEETKKLLEHNLRFIKTKEITPEINDLLKRQTAADTPGNPPLTKEERAQLVGFYSESKR